MRPVGRTKGVGVTQLAEVLERRERRLGPPQARIAGTEAHCDHAVPREARQSQVEDVCFRHAGQAEAGRRRKCASRTTLCLGVLPPAR